MLSALSIRDVVLIDRLDLAFERGLTAFTGETGAGKSILLDALGMALGDRADTNLIRTGAEQSTVTAEFLLASDHPAHLILSDQGLESGDSLVLRRVIARDGRSRALINDQPSSLALLRQIAETVIEIEGQHGSRALINPTTQLQLLDSFGVDIALRESATASWKSLRSAQQTLSAAKQAIEAARRDEEFLRHAFSELSSLAPKVEEEDYLAAERQRLQGAERRAAALEAALAELAPQDRGSPGPAAALRSAARNLVKVAATEPSSAVADAAAAIERAQDALAEAESLLTRASAEADADPHALNAIEERLFALRASARKHSVRVAELPALLDQFAIQLRSLDKGRIDLETLTANAETARAAYIAAAQTLRAARSEAARRLEAAISCELPSLKLERARLSIDCAELPEERWNEAGIDHIRFLAATNPGEPLNPIDRIVSGGELSRLMLALKVILARVGFSRSLIFDEVDSGIGGATAAAVGDRLARIATSMQVLVITHSPQVAARAHHHFVVSKSVQQNRARTEILHLDPDARRDEIARMLAGETVTDAARDAAHSLLERR